MKVLLSCQELVKLQFLQIWIQYIDYKALSKLSFDQYVKNKEANKAPVPIL